MNRSTHLPRKLRTNPQTSTRIRTRTRTTDPTRVPTYLRVLPTTFHTYQIILPGRRAQASIAMEEGLEIALCSSWMKLRVFLSLFRLVYQVVFTFRSCPSVREADGWKDAVHQEMKNLRSHDVYALVTRMNGIRTLKIRLDISSKVQEWRF